MSNVKLLIQFSTMASVIQESRRVSGRPAATLVRSIGLVVATSLVMGSVIGSAVFLTTGIMAQSMPSATLLLLVWVAGGVLALTGGLTCAELSAMYPQSGGWYV